MQVKKYKLITYTVLLLGTLVYVFITAPVLNPMYQEGAVFWATVITIFAGMWVLLRFGELTLHYVPPGEMQQRRPFQYQANEKIPRFVLVLLALPWVFVGLMLVYSSVFFQWKSYRDQLGTSQVISFSQDMQAVDMEQVPIVDESLALILADKKLGERAGLGSQVRVNTLSPTIQRINGKLVWAIPLNHSGFFKWITNLSGTPGYILVSATDVNDVEYVETHRVKYQTYGYFTHDIKRHVRLTGGWMQGLADPSFEIDENGQPYWVYTTYYNKRGFSLPEANGAWIVNATTGAKNYYAANHLPEWVDRLQPEAFIIQQINNKGQYVRGWLNFADLDKFKASTGHMIIYNNDRCYLFTGLTSVGGDNSAIGFIMVDMLTKESIAYEMAGATEEAAQGSAQGKVQHLGYRATFPLILNVDNQPTYFMALKDQSQLIKQFAFVSVSNYSIVGTGETMRLALQDYRAGLRDAGVATESGNAAAQTELTGKVWRIAMEPDSSQTVYKVILENHQDKLFICPATLSDELALTQTGDEVKITMDTDGAGIHAAYGFDNLDLLK